MPNPYFRFKQFTVYHDRCAMKVGTDGVLLGAWTAINRAKTILDIGAGSGLVTLMLAQCAESSVINSIEIDEQATKQANENYRQSPFLNITYCQHISLQQFALSSTSKYDLIVSNPPYFQDSLKSPDVQRTQARHTDILSIEELLLLSGNMLNNDGRISLIYPADDKDFILKEAGANGLFLSRLTNVFPTVDTDKPKRVLMEFSKNKKEPTITNLVIENSRHVYSSDFINLLQDFYLKM